MKIKKKSNGGLLEKDMTFLGFAKLKEAKWVLEARRRSFRGGFLQLDWWSPYSGCVKKKNLVKEVWIRVVYSYLRRKAHQGVKASWGLEA